MNRRLRVLWLWLFAAALAPAGAIAQALPSEPFTFGGGRVVVSADVAISIAPEDDGFFNYSDYEQTTLRQFRVGMSAQVRISERLSFLGEVRAENFEYVTPFAFYARIRPLPARRLDIQIGRIPPTFGSFARRAYSRDNPLIGYPLAYQYLTSLRADSVAADTEDLIAMKGRGWLSSFPVGNPIPDHGVPLVSAFSWDTGVQVSHAWDHVTAAIALTNGTPSNPRLADDNSGKQLAARVAVTPLFGLTIGGSYARGEFLDRDVSMQLPEQSANNSHDQLAAGFDVEYSREHWLARAEAVFSEWRMPTPITAADPLSLRARALMLEGRYAVAPGWYLAARADRLGFNEVATDAGPQTWEAPVRRLEVGVGYYVRRNVIVRTSLQFNHRDGGRVTESKLLAAQLLYWF
jgi:hypothetical protein